MLKKTLISIFFMIPILSYGSITADDVNIDTDLKEEFLFEVENIKPGDYMIREIKVMNTGLIEFNYHSETNFKGRSQKLYNQFDLIVEVDNEEVYNGKLNEFTGIESRFLDVEEEEEINLKIEFPYESGNEFQGLATEFEIKFWASGEPIEPVVSDSDEKPSFNGLLPQTGEESPIIYFIIGSLAIALGGTIYFKSRRKDVG